MIKSKFMPWNYGNDRNELLINKSLCLQIFEYKKICCGDTAFIDLQRISAKFELPQVIIKEILKVKI